MEHKQRETEKNFVPVFETLATANTFNENGYCKPSISDVIEAKEFVEENKK